MSAPTRVADAVLAELEQESAATRRMLERVPEDRLAWAPHPKSMTLGQLALHIAGIPEGVGSFLDLDELDADEMDFSPPEPSSRQEILARFDEGLQSARRRLDSLTDERAGEPWRLTKGGAEVFTIPRIGLVRTLMFNHLYHHRGQLTVYLRLLDVPVPVTYGRSADESLFD